MLRAGRLQLVGSRQGSVTTGEIVTALPAIAERITDGSLGIGARTVPLSDVEHEWANRHAVTSEP